MNRCLQEEVEQELEVDLRQVSKQIQLGWYQYPTLKY